MPRRCRAITAGEKAETVVEPGCNALYPQGRGARRSKLNCQRDAVEATTHPGDRGQIARARQEMWRGRAYPLDEQSNCAVAKRVLAIRAAFCRHGQRWYRVNPFALRPERLPAG